MSLQDYLARWGSFDWQTNNCTHFVAGWAGVELPDVEMPTGLLGMRRTLRALKASSFKQAVCAKLGDPVPPAFARVGDVVLAGPILGICNGRLFAAPRQDAPGVVFVPMVEAEAAWHVNS